MSIRRRPPPSSSSLVQRKRSGAKQVRKTVYLDPRTVERLDRYAFDHRLKVSDVVEAAVAEYMDRVYPRTKRRAVPEPPAAPAPSRRRSTAPPPPSTPPPSAPVSSRRSRNNSP